ncbi:MAG TPA: DUF59 domain-containing protein [Desulfobacteraceae bacterium]|nr:DUF59 domain-containing protein [Desulfobacteraceae bacterium]
MRRSIAMGQVTRDEVLKVASQVMHPAIDRSLLDLGIVKDIEIANNTATVYFAFPFPNIPIADHLINSVQAPLENLGLKVEVQIRTMNDQERATFLSMEQEAWKGM